MPNNKTTFHVKDMDCPSEEQIIRMALEPLGHVSQLEFDIPNRTLEVYHQGDPDHIAAELDTLGLGAKAIETTDDDPSAERSKGNIQRAALSWVLGINFSFFLIEMLSGWISHSMGLVADSLDMLADSMVYGLSLFAVGAAVATKKKIAKLSGYFQISLALLGFAEVLRRFFTDSQTPLFSWMILVATLALAANIVSLIIITKAKSSEAHMQASAIFTSNDIIVNGGVIIAGVLVYLLDSRWPDLLIGATVFTFVMKGALKILKLSKPIQEGKDCGGQLLRSVTRQPQRKKHL
ncbi:cation transporter [Pelagicoccus sp. SDUM812005]|uniref:cation transporter n=1 Tax=Pelagicoccus sp. SDUM812005 TaxID=3041257 RepID=UPI00280F3E7A|nr:cation transporter [Pelagicoccus sp. SDUM812005]MDQ8180375.1 cation transporter [Pelagicoccus sp. SDUM812005]